MKMRALRAVPWLALVVTFGISASEREIGPRDRECVSGESRIVTLAVDDSVVAVAQAAPILMNVELLPVDLNHPFAVVISRTGDVFTRVVGVSGQPGELRLLIPYSENWDIDRVIITGLRNEAGQPRNVSLSREQLRPTTVAKDFRVATDRFCWGGCSTSACFAVTGGMICYNCSTTFGIETCGDPYWTP